MYRTLFGGSNALWEPLSSQDVGVLLLGAYCHKTTMTMNGKKTLVIQGLGE